ncbi:hypothetical protein C7S14_5372 [Burkholderia cepacia]|nr:hypothetical protein C7S14_5372 [Burkholderia cepacia]
MRVVTRDDSTHSIRRAKENRHAGGFFIGGRCAHITRAPCRSTPAVVATVVPMAVTAIPAGAAAVTAVPLVAAPVATAVPVAVAMPADHDSRRRCVDGCRRIDRRRLIDDRRRRRRRIHRCGRDVDRCRNAEIDPDIDSRHCCARHEQGRHTGQERGNTQGLHGFLFGGCWMCDSTITASVAPHISSL